MTSSCAATLSVINLQLRSPDTGFVFSPQDIHDFKQSNIRCNVTCHEYKLNEERPFFQAVLHDYFKAADVVTFFNKSDFARAKKHANHTAFNLDGSDFKKTKQRAEERKEEWKKFGEDKFEQWTNWFKHESYCLDHKKVIFTRVPPTVKYDEITFETFQQKNQI